MTYEQAMHFWFGRINYEVKSPRPSDLTLDRMRDLLQFSATLKIAIASSTSPAAKERLDLGHARVHSRQAGYRTGLFTSPHLSKSKRRIQVRPDADHGR